MIDVTQAELEKEINDAVVAIFSKHKMIASFTMTIEVLEEEEEDEK